MKDRCSRRFILTTLAVMATGAFVAGCGDDDEDSASSQTAKPAAFQITATAEGTKRKVLEFPSTVKAGLVTVTLRNEDKAPRSAQLIRVTGDQTVDDVLKIVDAEEATKIPSFMQDGGGLGAVPPGTTASATQVLAPGKWVIWDDEGGDVDGPGNSDLGAKGEFTVTGEASDAELPDQGATVTTADEGEGKAKEYDFVFDGLKAGTYAVVCFISDRAGGKPHAAKGMLEELTVE